VDRRSPELPGMAVGLNGTLWLNRATAQQPTPVYQRLDPATWQVMAMPWRVPQDCGDIVGAGGSAWCTQNVGRRLDIQMTGFIAGPSPSASRSPSPSPAASAS
jgi:hypothetical protein